MNPDPSPGWLARHIDLIYRLVLLALIGLWVAFPPHASHPASQAAAALQVIEASGSGAPGSGASVARVSP